LPFPQPEITSNVSFTVIAREIRCKWSTDNDKASLSAAQAVLEEALPALKADGRTVKRVVCGGCQDFKIITSGPAEAHEAFSAAGHGGEDAIIAKLNAIEGINTVETQTYTFTDM
jgi:hypothetical protein